MSWRLFRILNAGRGQLGRELASGYILESLAAAKSWADTRIPALAIRALNTKTGEYCDRVDGKAWGEQQPPQLMSKAGEAPRETATTTAPDAEPAVQPWWLRDDD